MIKVKINNKEFEVEEGSTILEACKKVNINIKTLCHMNMIDGKSVNCKGTCRVCVVEVVGKDKLVPACSEKIREGAEIVTNSKKVIEARKTIVELLLSNHPNDCLKCERNLSCELQEIARDLNIDRIDYQGEETSYQIDDSSNAIIRDMNKCILCRRCVTACNEVQNTSVLTMNDRGFETNVSTFFNKALVDTECTYCGQCVAVCPTAALTEAMDYKKIVPLIGDRDKKIVVQIAPAVRVALGEEFGLDINKISTGKIVAALKLIGMDKVFDTNFAADLTIMEEATEFVERFTKKENLPLITSCCPGWVNYAEKNYHNQLNLLSTCKSPQQMFGAIAKTYLAKKLNVKAEKLVVVSVMPCIAKKVEARRENMKRDGISDVDIVITTRELAKLIKHYGIDIVNIKEEAFDNPLGEASGAGAIFGTTGGVMEAALRTAYKLITDKDVENLDFKDVRGFKGIKESTININNIEVRLAIVNSLSNAKIILDEIEKGIIRYDFIEIMACPIGCIDGGGQPFIKSDKEILKKRMEAIYEIDSNSENRLSHENSSIKNLYNEFLEKPNSNVAHKILHTNYEKK